MRNFFREMVYIRKADRIAIIFLLCLIVAIGIIVWLLGNGRGDVFAGDNDSTMVADTTGGYYSGRRYYNGGYYGGRDTMRYAVDGRQYELFPFDPNTADSTQLLRLGLSPWQVRNIYRYRAAGGIYRVPTDFAQLYGLTVKDYKRLEPYIRISADYGPAAERYQREEIAFERSDSMRYPAKLRPMETIELNHADTNMLKRVPGIGSGYARRIVAYRERLGGFYSISQLCDIDGLSENSIDYFTLDSIPLRKIKINRLDINQLRRHPYINFHQAKAICDYRRLHGNITSLQQLRLSRDFPPEAIERLEHYVEY